MPLQKNKLYLLFKTVLFIGFAVLLFSCEDLAIFSEDKNTSLADTLHKNSYLISRPTGKPYAVTGKEVAAGNPIITTAGKPEITPGFNNVHEVGFLRTRKNVEGEVLTGVKTKTVKAGFKNIAYINHKTVVALAPGMREQNPLGLKFYDIQHGLSSSYIRCMLQDRNGNIWFGTASGGACKFDGNDFTYFTEKQGMPNNSVVCIIEDRKGNIWFGTDGGGACRYDGKTFSVFSEKEGLINNAVWSMLEDKNGNIWIGTAGGGACKYDGTNFTIYNKDNGLNTNYIISMEQDKNGNLWFGSYGDGALKYDGKNFTAYTETEGLIDNTVQTILADNAGNVWFGTYENGLCKLKGNTFTYYTEETGLMSNQINALIEDKGGSIWIGFNSKGVCKFNGMYFTCFTEYEGMSGATVSSLLEDNNGDIWFGTSGHGVTKYDNSCFTHFTKKEGLSSNVVSKTYEDHAGNLWFGTNGGGVCKYDKENFYTYTTEQGLANNRVFGIIEDADHNMWFGTNGGGLCKFDGKNFYTYTDEQGLSGNKIYCLLEDHNHDLWIATNGGGVCKFDGETFTQYKEAEGLSNDIVYSIIEDKQNNLWFTTDGGGVCKFDRTNFTLYTKKEGLASNIVYSVLQDTKGNFWFGTDEGGVCRYDGKQFQSFKEENGISNDKVWSILQDVQGDVWLGTESGLTRVNAGSLNKKEINVNVYKLNNGFLGNDVLQNSGYQDKKGFIWWGTGKMLTRYNPSIDAPDRLAPIMHVKNIKLQFQNVDWNAISSNKNYKDIKIKGLTKWYNLPSDLSLPYYQNRITFGYVGINYKSQDKILYQYKLEGLEDKWSPPTTKTDAAYNNLQPGDFTFKVKAVNKDGFWSDPASFNFTIRAPWWQTWWFRILALMFTAAAIIAFFRYRTNALRQKQKVLEDIVEQRTSEVVKQKELVEEKSKEVLDSINYAKRIQRSILPPLEEMQRALKNYFVLYKPKAIISGDFYWMCQVKTSTDATDLVVLAVVDCTGHGVPGALMSIVGNTLLNQTIKNPDVNTPAHVLDFLNEELPKNLKQQQEGEIIRDGMDMTICAINFKNNVLYFAGANNSIYITRNNELIEFKGDKQAVSGSSDDKKMPYTDYFYKLEKNDMIYMLTDGYADQFGGPNGKKFKHKQLETLLLYICDKPVDEQQRILDQTFEEWRGDQEQVDDVTIFGIRI